MAHLHDIRDNDSHFIIDPETRNVTNRTGAMVTVMQYDHNSERVTFEIPKEIEGHDMSLSDIVQVFYENTSKGTSASNRVTVSGANEIFDMAPAEDDPDVLVFSWLIGQQTTQLAGTIKFQIRFVCHGDTAIPEYSWRTNPCTAFIVLPSIDAVSDAVETHPDIFIELDRRIDQLEEHIDNDAEEVGARVSDLETRLSNLIADLEYEEIVINSFTIDKGNNIREIGSTVTEVMLDYSMNKPAVALSLDGEPFDMSATPPELGITTGSYWIRTLSLTSDKTWILEATDERDFTAKKSATLHFYNGIYYGMAPDLTPENINSSESMSKFIMSLADTGDKILSGTKNRTIKAPGGENKYFWYAYPSRLGTSVFNIGGFDYEYPHITMRFVNEYGYEEIYNVYRSDEFMVDPVSIVVKGG